MSARQSLLLLLLLPVLLAACAGGQPTTGAARPDTLGPKEVAVEHAILTAGCFWGVEHLLRSLPGVVEAEVGYCGGETAQPTYEQVCTGTTGQAEAVRVAFDPQRLSYDQVLEAFWNLHDPTTLNRQGPDAGTQYRSAIFTLSAAQERIALASRAAAQRCFDREIVTEITPATRFWPAEAYHQRYLERNGRASCHVWRPGPRVITARLVLDEAEWRRRLDGETFRILRQSHTQPPFCGAYHRGKADGEGTYRCAGCALDLFTSADRFDSGTGWPSFRAALRGRVEEVVDGSHGMVRTEVRCWRCGGHLGHVFDDGPPPGGRRYCINAAALEFTPRP